MGSRIAILNERYEKGVPVLVEVWQGILKGGRVMLLSCASGKGRWLELFDFHSCKMVKNVVN